MLCAYVICHCFFRTLFAFISKITFVVTIFYVPTCSQNFYKFKGLLNAIKMTIILIRNCITKRTHHIAGFEKSQSIYCWPPFYAASTHSGCLQTTPEYLVFSLSANVIHTTCPLKTGLWHPKQYDLYLALTDGIVHLLFYWSSI